MGQYGQVCKGVLVLNPTISQVHPTCLVLLTAEGFFFLKCSCKAVYIRPDPVHTEIEEVSSVSMLFALTARDYKKKL